MAYKSDSKKNNIILIGMPGCGKSTLGAVLAKAMKLEFIDSDRLIEEAKGASLDRILAEYGPDEFNKIEEEVNSNIDIANTVLATGGSVVYGDDAMKHLGRIGNIVFIRLDYDTIEKRLGNFEERGISIKDGMSLKELFDERQPLYEKYADIIIDTKDLEIEDAMIKIKEAILEER